MSRQDYEKIAQAINRAKECDQIDCECNMLCLACLSHELGLVFENDNPQFNWSQWEAALGIGGDDVHE